MMKSSLDYKRFWAKVEKTDRCWNWTGAIFAKGYGLLGYNGHNFTVHRFSWVIHNGPIPDNKWVLHHCDNPKCVKPEHLYLGTAQDNADDMVARGRQRKPAKECKQGHALGGSNLGVTMWRGRAMRRCITCARERGRNAHRLKRGLHPEQYRLYRLATPAPIFQRKD